MANEGFDISALLSNDPDEQLKVTFPFSDQVNVTLKYVSRERMAELMKKATKTVYVKHQSEQHFDQLLYGELLGKEAIDGWDGLVIENNPFPCDDGNRAIVMRRWTAFAKFVSDTATDLERMVAAQQENAAKNSETTSGRS